MAPSLPTITVPKSPRFAAYNALMVFSAVSLAAIASSDPDEKRTEDKWVLAVGSVSMVLAFFAVMAHFFDGTKDMFVGTMVEGVFAVVLVGFWAGGLPVIMDPDNRIAAVSIGFTGGVTGIINSNLYFASWICLGQSMWILGHFLQEKANKDFVNDTTTKTAKWYGLMAFSIVLIASCSKYHKNNNCGDTFFKDTDQCTRNKFGISLGALGITIGIAMALLTAKGTLAVMYEMIVSTVSLILFTFGVGYMTFGSGPATTIGNQYFSIWLAFICCVSLFSESSREYIATFNKEEGATAVPSKCKETEEAAETGTGTKIDEEMPEGPTEAMEVKL